MNPTVPARQSAKKADVAGARRSKVQESLKDLELKQKNKAATYYQMLATKYPESEYAEKAKQRIQQIGPPTATPAPKKK